MKKTAFPPKVSDDERKAEIYRKLLVRSSLSTDHVNTLISLSKSKKGHDIESSSKYKLSQQKDKASSRKAEYVPVVAASSEEAIYDTALQAWMKSHELSTKASHKEKLKNDSTNIIQLTLKRKETRPTKVKESGESLSKSNVNKEMLMDMGKKKDIVVGESSLSQPFQIPEPPVGNEPNGGVHKTNNHGNCGGEHQNERNLLQLPVDAMKQLEVQLNVIQNSARKLELRKKKNTLVKK